MRAGTQRFDAGVPYHLFQPQIGWRFILAMTDRHLLWAPCYYRTSHNMVTIMEGVGARRAVPLHP